MVWCSVKEPVCSEERQTEIFNNITAINIACSNLHNIPDWILKCKNLKILDCSQNQITQLPETLPDSLQILWCNNNKLTQLPKLPCSLQMLFIQYNQLTQLPNLLPPKLKELECQHNKLIKLPDVLPNLLKSLRCYGNQITQLPEILPNSSNACSVSLRSVRLTAHISC